MSTLTPFSQDGPHVGVRIHFPKSSMPPFSLYIAKMLPVKVTQPTSAERPAARTVTCSSSPSGTVLASSSHRHVSDSATSADAAPPKPLNSATISGIPVISTRTAMMYPIPPPRRMPPAISAHSIPVVNPICNTVVRTATSIPMAP